MLRSGFYNGEDREYFSGDISRVVSNLVVDGVFGNYGDRFVVDLPNDAPYLTVRIGSGLIWWKNFWVHNDIPEFNKQPEIGLDGTRWDLIVLDIDNNDNVRKTTYKTIKGAPGSSTKPLPITTDKIYQIPLCYIERDSNNISMNQIHTCVGEELPFISGILQTISISELMGSWQADLDAAITTVENVISSSTNDINTFLETSKTDVDVMIDNSRDTVNGFLTESETKVDTSINNSINTLNTWMMEAETRVDNFITTTEESNTEWMTLTKQAFTTWFDQIKGQLSEDQAGHLMLLYQELEAHKANRSVLHEIELTTLWNGTQIPFTQTINIENITSEDVVIIGYPNDLSDITKKQIDDVNLSVISNNGFITLECYGIKNSEPLSLNLFVGGII